MFNQEFPGGSSDFSEDHLLPRKSQSHHNTCRFRRKRTASTYAQQLPHPFVYETTVSEYTTSTRSPRKQRVAENRPLPKTNSFRNKDQLQIPSCYTGSIILRSYLPNSWNGSFLLQICILVYLTRIASASSLLVYTSSESPKEVKKNAQITVVDNSQGAPLCLAKNGDVGVCVFLKTCLDSHGILAGTCAKSFFLASCCILPNSTSTSNEIAETAQVSAAVATTGRAPNFHGFNTVSIYAAQEQFANREFSTTLPMALNNSQKIVTKMDEGSKTTAKRDNVRTRPVTPWFPRPPVILTRTTRTTQPTPQKLTTVTTQQTTPKLTTKATDAPDPAHQQTTQQAVEIGKATDKPTAKPTSVKPAAAPGAQLTTPRSTTTTTKKHGGGGGGKPKRTPPNGGPGATSPIVRRSTTTPKLPYWLKTTTTAAPDNDTTTATTNSSDATDATSTVGTTDIMWDIVPHEPRGTPGPTVHATNEQNGFLVDFNIHVNFDPDNPHHSVNKVDFTEENIPDTYDGTLSNSALADTLPVPEITTTTPAPTAAKAITPTATTSMTTTTTTTTTTTSLPPTTTTTTTRSTTTTPKPTLPPATTTTSTTTTATTVATTVTTVPTITFRHTLTPTTEDLTPLVPQWPSNITGAADSTGQVTIQLSEICGITPLLWKRIVGGSETKFGQFPWMVSLRRIVGYISSHRCGAVLVHPKWVLTAAHCASDIPTEKMVVRIGEHDLSDANSVYPHIDMRVTERIIHEKFNFLTFENDIALLRLAEPVSLAPHIIPICMAPYKNYTGTMGTITGWGRLSQGGPLPARMNAVSVPFISKTECQEWFSAGDRRQDIESCFICAGYKNGGRDACQGDSGGPVVQQVDGRWGLIGVISWGIGCAEPNLPGVSTLVPLFVDWIQRRSNGDIYLPEFYANKYGIPPPATSGPPS